MGTYSPGFAAVGICSPQDSHYRRVFTDAVQAVATARAHDAVDSDRVESVLRTSSCIDGVNVAVRARAPALISVGLRDMTCPPSTVYAVYNHYGGPKEIVAYPYDGHEGGGEFQVSEHLRHLRALAGG